MTEVSSPYLSHHICVELVASVSLNVTTVQVPPSHTSEAGSNLSHSSEAVSHVLVLICESLIHTYLVLQGQLSFATCVGRSVTSSVSADSVTAKAILHAR